MKSKLKYKRVLLKLTGELFGKDDGRGLEFVAFETIGRKLINIVKATNSQISIVVGGGNIFRGRERNSKVDETTADYMGMLATVINGMALQESLERLGQPTRMMTAFEIKAVAEPYIRRRAIRHLEKGRIVIFTAGVGSPYFTSDSGAALRALETNCDVLIKATNVNGIYSEDPRKNPNAKLFKKISYDYALKHNLEILDATAFALCQRQNIPLVVLNIKNLEKITDLLRGKKIGSLVQD